MADSFRVGIIGGASSAGRLHVSTWRARDDVELVAVADPSPSALEAVRSVAGLSVRDAHLDPLDLVRRDDIDAVHVCAPLSQRCRLIVEAARAGKHIFAERLPSTTPASAAKAVDAAGSAGVTFATGHDGLVREEIRAARAVIASGEIGVVRTATVNYLGADHVARRVGDRRQAPARSGGEVLLDVADAVHLLEVLLDEHVEGAAAFVGSVIPHSRVGHVVLGRFETATKVGMVNVGWGLGGGHLEVAGTKGHISITYPRGGVCGAPLASVVVTNARGTRTALRRPRGSGECDESASMLGTLPLMINDFLAAARFDGRPLASGADGLRVIEATVGAYEAALTGRRVEIPLDRGGPAFRWGAAGLS